MEAVHYSPEQLNERFSFAARFKTIVFGLIGIGLVLLITGYFLAHDPAGHGSDSHAAAQTEQSSHAVSDQLGDEAHGGEADHADDAHGGGHGHHQVTKGTRLLSNLLLNSVYFLTVAMGAFFFLAVHQIGNAGWHTAIRRVPEAIVSYLPVGIIGFVTLFFFLDHLYEWAILPEGADALIDEKRAYLNETGFIIRALLFFGGWIGAAFWLRRLSVRQDEEGGLTHFSKSTTISAIFIIFFAISYTLFSIDWLKSLEPHWFSTIYGVYLFAGSMVSSMVFIYLILRFLKQQGYMPYVNDSHFHDLGKYIFGFSVFWAYIWVAQYLLIWYSNIPEEGIYYVKRYRTEDPSYLGYAGFFYANLFFNFFVPFFGLMTRNAKRSLAVFLPIAAVLIYGHYHDLFLLIMPGAMGQNPGIGLLEVGFFLTFLGIFLFAVFTALEKAGLAPVKHPYLEESLHHTTGPV